MLAKSLEDAMINAYLNYLLDPSCINETWPSFLYSLVEEFLEVGENMRTWKVHTESYKRTYSQQLRIVINYLK